MTVPLSIIYVFSIRCHLQRLYKKFNYKLMFMIKTFLQRDFEFSKLPFHLYKKKCGTFTNLKSEKQNDLRKLTNFFQITDFKEHSNVAVEKKLSIL